MEIRSVEIGDRDEWLRMRDALWPDSLDDHRREIAEFLRRRPGDETVLVAARGPARLGGFAEVRARAYAEGCRSSPVGYLEGWWVDADLRRRGVGARLVAAAEAWARSRGLVEMASDADLGNETSQRAHRALGFTEVERIVCFRKALAPGAAVTSALVDPTPPDEGEARGGGRTEDLTAQLTLINRRLSKLTGQGEVRTLDSRAQSLVLHFGGDVGTVDEGEIELTFRQVEAVKLPLFIELPARLDVASAEQAQVHVGPYEDRRLTLYRFHDDLGATWWVYAGGVEVEVLPVFYPGWPSASEDDPDRDP